VDLVQWGRRVSHVKRFLEIWVADPNFRRDVLDSPATCTAQRNVAVDLEAIRVLWDPKCAAQLTRNDSVQDVISKRWPQVQDYLDYRHIRAMVLRRAREAGKPVDERFAAWRERQLARLERELIPGSYNASAHPIFAAELSNGCSVGCWFCGFDADKLDRHFESTPGNSKLWTECLTVLRHLCGATASATGLLYWATDPFDNPGYETFCEDFYQAFGQYPRTTTALASFQLQRAHRFIVLAESKGSYDNRFSILSLSALQRIHEAFTAEELAHVDLILLNQESAQKKLRTGRANSADLPKRLSEQLLDNRPGQTIASVSGFLLNMVRRSVSLITPCGTTEASPKGYFTLEDRSFNNSGDLERAIETMIEMHMPMTSLESEKRTATPARRDTLWR